MTRDLILRVVLYRNLSHIPIKRHAQGYSLQQYLLNQQPRNNLNTYQYLNIEIVVSSYN